MQLFVGIIILVASVCLHDINASVYSEENGLYAPGYEDALEQLEIVRQQEILRIESFKNEAFREEAIIKTDSYLIDPPEDFSLGIIIDPCKNREANCCQDNFGTPIYAVPGSELDSDIGAPEIVDADGNPLFIEVSRLADRFSVWDPECFETEDGEPYRVTTTTYENGTQVPKTIYDDPTCVSRLRALVPSDEVVMPACWDRNKTVDALEHCYSVDGTQKHNCVSVGYHQTTYIVQCGKQYSLDDHCGTFLELHEHGSEEIISQTRILGEYASGYRTTTIPLTYKGNRNQTVCVGDYEIWWVLRTKSNYIVQAKKSFYLSNPRCDFDEMTNLYKHFATIS